MPHNPPGAFLLWIHKRRSEMPALKDLQLDNRAVSRILGDRWRKLSAAEKPPWIAMGKARLQANLQQKYAFLEATGAPLPVRARNKRGNTEAIATAATQTGSNAQSAVAPV